ncbi:hypothetical protein IE53DRAFT_321762 [Violaceomyces palustris]|uniref:Uncharacterized protein n=1 Tax=Violaceomyces palustris TaxID=1673888 RepID=A0ACD0NMZ8_9BASI|nr:hypothetical protein IE53DRAFT_321762 [Violaceomyces palustris]
MSEATVSVKVEFGGGTELLLAPPQDKRHNLRLPRLKEDGTSQTDVHYLIEWIRRNLIVEREELFVEGDSV